MRLGPWGLSNLPKVTGANQEQSPALDFATQDDPRVSSPQGQDGVPDGPLLPQSDGPLTASPWGLGHTRRSLASADSLAALQVGLLASRPHGPDARDAKSRRGVPRLLPAPKDTQRLLPPSPHPAAWPRTVRRQLPRAGGGRVPAALRRKEPGSKRLAGQASPERFTSWESSCGIHFKGFRDCGSVGSRTHLEVLLGKKPKATGAAQATGGQCAQRPLQGRKRPAPHLEAPSPPSPAPPSLASLGIPRSGSAPGAPRGRPPALPDSSLLARTHVLAEAAPHRKQARTDRTGGARAEGPARAPRLRPHPTRRAGVSGGLSSLAAWPHPPGPRAPGPPLTDGAGAWKRLPPGLTTPLPTERGGGGGAHSQPHPPPPAFLARPLPGALPQPRSLTLGLSPSQQEAQPGRRAESNWPRWRAAPNLGGATLGSRRPPAPGCAPLGGKTEHQRAETQASPAQSGWAPHLFSKHFAERIKGHCTGSRVPDGSGGAGFAEAGTYRATLLSPSS
ncbi:unnamed protein product [Rangifer tarandus platyrhynchus]|uniref:Uncharacterized protein n=1 Tax=Rangifer tarandus platyrhynchus TaxID=3082113 RepID=A0ABN8YAF8_RANTA|nr:unnamed protein product [Rangifer tarandus platyrhynchus]